MSATLDHERLDWVARVLGMDLRGHAQTGRLKKIGLALQEIKKAGHQVPPALLAAFNAAAAAIKAGSPGATVLVDAVELAASAVPAAPDALAARRADYAVALQAATVAAATLADPQIVAERNAIAATLINPAVACAGRQDFLEAMVMLGEVDGACQRARATLAAHVAFMARLKPVQDKLAAQVHPLVAAEVARIKAECVTPAVTAAAAPERGFARAGELLAQAEKRCAAAELQVRRYETGLARAEADAQAAPLAHQVATAAWAARGHPVLVGVSDVLGGLGAKIAAAKLDAAAGQYLPAMQKLEEAVIAVRSVAAPAAAHAAFIGELTKCEQLAAVAKADSVNPEPMPPVLAAVAALEVDILAPAEVLAVAGGTAQARALLAGFDDRNKAVTKLTAVCREVIALRVAAKVVIDALPIAGEKARLTRDRLVASDALLAQGNHQAATALLAKVAAECQAITAYAVGLANAKAAVAALAAGAAADGVRITRDYIASAEAFAANFDYATAIAQLGRVGKECEAATTAWNGVASCRANKQVVDAAFDGDAIGCHEAVGEMFAELKAIDDSALLPDRLAAIDALIVQAGASIAAGKLADAKVKLAQASEDIVTATGFANELHQASQMWDSAQTMVETLPLPVAPEKAAINARLLVPAAAAREAGRSDDALQLIAQIRPAVLQARALAEQITAYTAKLEAVRNKANELGDAFVAREKKQIVDDCIKAAESLAETRKFGEALAKLAPADGLIAVANELVNLNAAYAARVATLKAKKTGITAALAIPDLPPSAVLVARVAALGTDYLDAAAAAVAGRGIGDVAAMHPATGLVDAGIDRAAALEAEVKGYAMSHKAAARARLRLTNLEAMPSHGTVAGELAEVKALMARAGVKQAVGQFVAAADDYSESVVRCNALRVLVEFHQSYQTLLGTARTRATACKVQLDTLPVPVAPIAALYQAVLGDGIAAAEAAAARRDYTAATARLDTIDGACARVEGLVAQHKAYAIAAAAVDVERAKLVQPVVAAEAARIDAERVTPAKTAAAALDYGAATALLVKARAECAAALTIMTQNAAAEQARAAVAGNPAAAADAVQALLAKLLTHAARDAIKPLTDVVAATIATAQAGPAQNAHASLVQAADLCVAAGLVAERHVIYLAALRDVEAETALLTEALIQPDRARIQQDFIAAAKLRVSTRDYAGAMALLDRATAACATARVVVMAQANYQAALTAAQARLAALGPLAPPDPVIGADATKIKTELIDAAIVAAAARDYAQAGKLLAQVAGRCKKLALQKKMQGGAAPAPAELTALMDEPGGVTLLDGMIATLPDTTKRDVIEAALVTRFGLAAFKSVKSDGSAADAGKPKAKSIKKIYQLLALVPASHTNNPSLKEIERSAAKTTGDSNYAGVAGKIVLKCGRAPDAAPAFDVARASLALPEVEPDCVPVADGPDSPPANYFSWTTLHEVGHAVDDKKRFMSGKAGSAAFGGWQTHGGDVAPVAAAIAAEVGFVGGANYLAGYLLKAAAAPPVAPAGREDWAAVRQRAEAWCDAIRVGAQLWDNGGAAAKHVAGGRVYHEAYAGQWVSYEFAARKQGITGYQFRAPGEWLAELYAGYHAKKLKPTHPAATWLAEL